MNRQPSKSRPLFMSQQHVDEVNAILRGVPKVLAAASALASERMLVYELGEGPHGHTIYWVYEAGPRTGVHFSLGRPQRSPDVLVKCDWAEMVRSSRNEREGKAPTVREEVEGDQDLMLAMLDIIELARPYATVDVLFPDV